MANYHVISHKLHPKNSIRWIFYFVYTFLWSFALHNRIKISWASAQIEFDLFGEWLRLRLGQKKR